jgi:ubiquinone/menaquinone biosynthesis C-methylase UbiE
MPMNYGKVAQSYQFLSRMVFGNALLNAQRKALRNLSFPCNMLMIGGGDGEILKHLSDFEGVLDYVEISSEMVGVAQSKTNFAVNWHVQDIFSFKTDRKYDVIFMPFLLDNFTTKQCSELIAYLKPMLKNGGQAIVVDFTEKPNLWQKVLLFGMYTFFGLIAQVEINKMPEIEQTMAIHKLQKTLETKSFRGFIEIKKYSLNS